MVALLSGGDRRSLGRADELVAMITRRPLLFPRLIEAIWSEDPVVRMRAADAAEKITRARPEWLRVYKKELLGLMAEEMQPEVRWHLALLVPRLRLMPAEKEFAMSCLRRYLEDRSSIVKTLALQAFCDFAIQDPALAPEVIDVLRGATRTGTAAMKARSRILLAKLEKVSG